MARKRTPACTERRSACPINASLELLGDRWSLLVVRDLMFAGFRTYKEFLSSEEGIATNILADRLASLESAGIVTSRRDPGDRRRLIYRLTAKGMDLAPVLMELSQFGVKHEGGAGPAAAIVRGWKADREGFLAELRERWTAEEAAARAERSAGRRRRS